jgi:hypothetical protein
VVSQTYAQYVALPRYARDYLTREAFMQDRALLQRWHLIQAVRAAGLRTCDLCEQPVEFPDTALCPRCAWLPGVTE